MSSNPKRKKVLIIQSLIPHYRVPIFNQLSESVDLTVVYDKGNVPVDAKFATVKIDLIHIKHLPYIHRRNMLRLAKEFDVIISMLDRSFLTTHLLCHFRGKAKLILWGIGVAAGYNTRFDSVQETVTLYAKMIRKADAGLFYSRYPIKKYESLGIDSRKLFVANNTVSVLPIKNTDKENILFVGSLYKAKKIFELLKCYKKAYNICPNVPKLEIIGDGEEAQAVKKWVLDNGLQSKINLIGAIYDEEKLSQHFSKAIVCISPDQAGLAVLQSLGYGVAFVTHQDAITGGERLNIESGKNGVLFNSFDDISDIICDCANNKSHYIEMGKNAKKFYDENRTVEHMVSGFLDAIAFVTKE